MILLFSPETPDPLLRIADGLARKIIRKRASVLRAIQTNPGRPVATGFLYLDPDGVIRESTGHHRLHREDHRQRLLVMHLTHDVVRLLGSRPTTSVPIWRQTNEHVFPPTEALHGLVWAWLWQDNYLRLLDEMNHRELLTYKRALLKAEDPAANNPAIQARLREETARALSKPKPQRS